MAFNYTREIDEWISDLFLANMRCDDIAVRVGHGLSGKAVRKRIARMGLTRSPIAPRRVDYHAAWTAARIAELEALWATGEPYSKIADKLDITKNAVIGKCYRLGLMRKPAVVKRQTPPSESPVALSAPSRPIVARPVTGAIDLTAKVTAANPVAGSGSEIEPAFIVARSEEKPVITCPATLPLAPRLPVQGFEKEPALTSPHPVTIRQLGDTQCKWPIGDPAMASFRYCGAAQAGGTGQPYCAHHREMSSGIGTVAERKSLRALGGFR